jgi:hypothetical protein
MKRLLRAIILLISWTHLSAAESGSSTNAFGFDDFLMVPLRVHLVTAHEKPRLSTTLRSSDIKRILGKVNGIWAQAGIQFYLESLLEEKAVNPALHDEHRDEKRFNWLIEMVSPETRASNLFNVYYVKELSVNGIYMRGGIFVKDTAVLSSVPGGINEPLPRVTAHELGHGLSLEHRQNKTNLLASGTTGTSLNETEIKQARAAAAHFAWIEPAPAVLKRANELRESGRSKEAGIWYERVFALPVRPADADSLRKRIKQ